ncbi:hypothetical protein N657DRAFT_567170 [Parathielavia appendiculata]|uniref:RING-type domain-containing protein n=1 Tax=Parathielavia appendiculata TaxID=2587402 RepID=A0AAN6Z5A4_9PEZI|nr:hypothetical protein N657DRAFT_567170 [Parathielavia appendiculata]
MPFETSCFVPDPRYTFLFDPTPRENLICAICTESHLSVPWSWAAIRDSNPSLLPCGHVFGHKCLQIWLRTHDTCPACRFRLKYDLCKHPIPPRRLTRESLLLVPPTIPDGGAVSDQCSWCRTKTDQMVILELCVPLAGRYYELKATYERTGSEVDRKKTATAKGHLDKVLHGLVPPNDWQW